MSYCIKAKGQPLYVHFEDEHGETVKNFRQGCLKFKGKRDANRAAKYFTDSSWNGVWLQFVIKKLKPIKGKRAKKC